MDGTTDSIRILHTSDWHLGRQLYGRRRTDEFEAFLSWLSRTIDQERIQVLLVSGDIFDTTTPGSTAQRCYYDFLGKLAHSSCEHVVIISGNHDSPSLLGASASLLSSFNIHVVTDAIAEKEAVLLDDDEGRPFLGVIAIPFLHDRDIRISVDGESLEDKEQAYQTAIARHFAEAQTYMQSLRGKGTFPVICMAHLFTTGATTVEGDGVRDLAVGSLSHVPSSIFPSIADYTALGHLHVPQKVAGNETIRYCGSPIPMGFGEANQHKQVCVIEVSPDQKPFIRTIEIPSFRKLVQIQGTLPQIKKRLQELNAMKGTSLQEPNGRPIWVEVTYDGDDIITDLQQDIQDIVEKLAVPVEILAIRNLKIVRTILQQQSVAQTLETLTPQDVFRRCLDENEIQETNRPELLRAFDEIYHSVLTSDGQEE